MVVAKVVAGGGGTGLDAACVPRQASLTGNRLNCVTIKHFAAGTATSPNSRQRTLGQHSALLGMYRRRNTIKKDQVTAWYMSLMHQAELKNDTYIKLYPVFAGKVLPRVCWV